MAIAPFRIGQLEIPTNQPRAASIDWSKLNDIGDTIAGYRQKQAISGILQQATDDKGNIDYDRAGSLLAQNGLTDQARPMLALAQSKEAGRRAGAGQAETARHNQAIEGIARDRLSSGQGTGSSNGRAPAGYRWTEDGSLEAIPGGPRSGTKTQNAPSGYRWLDPADPEKGLAPIAGGPAEKVAAEVAARLGLAKSFLGQLDEFTDAEGNKQEGLRARIKRGDATGLIDASKGYMGMGGPGEIRRQLDSGAEALLRSLTGAGMNHEEAANYVRRYQFHPTDKAETLISKTNQLERELREVIGTVGRGRGGLGDVAPPQPGAPGSKAPPTASTGAVAPVDAAQWRANPAATIRAAQEAIAKGKDPAAVAARLKQLGIDPSALNGRQ